jgi:hypothetical protein
MGTPATYRDGDAFQWDWEVNPSLPTATLPTETIRPVDVSDPSNGLNPTESIFPTESILPADSFLPPEQGGVVHHDIHYDLTI